MTNFNVTIETRDINVGKGQSSLCNNLMNLLKTTFSSISTYGNQLEFLAFEKKSLKKGCIDKKTIGRRVLKRIRARDGGFPGVSAMAFHHEVSSYWVVML